MIIRSIVVGALVLGAACSKSAVQSTPNPSREPAIGLSSGTIRNASAVVRDIAGKRVGTVNFSDTPDGVRVRGDLADLGLGAHGVHIHEVGKCEAPFASAGGHFNPEHHQHGFNNPNGPHLGDMANVDMPAAGKKTFEFVLKNVTLSGTNALLGPAGAAIVVHVGRDDYMTDPAGNSGARIACGVIVGR